MSEITCRLCGETTEVSKLSFARGAIEAFAGCQYFYCEDCFEMAWGSEEDADNSLFKRLTVRQGKVWYAWPKTKQSEST